MERISEALRCSLALLIAVTALSGCQADQISPGTHQTAALDRLELRVKQLEQQAGQPKQIPDADAKTPAGPIKSLTFRMGTVDDRLRIYWADGSSSDLPCNKESKGVWACG